MDAEVIAALIAAIVALGTSLVAVYQQRALRRHQDQLTERQIASNKELELLRHQFEAQQDQEKRERDVEQQLNFYREPLLDAARDLSHRIQNISQRGFLGYLNSSDEHRQQMAMLGDAL